MAGRKIEKLDNLMRAIRACFQAMKVAGDHLHFDFNINASTRAVLEYLTTHDNLTVPEIARAKNVTRQHIQQLTDILVAAGFALYAENPEHRRSPLVRLTRRGREVFRKARAREAPYIAKIATLFETGELDTASSVLTRLRAALAEILERENHE